VNISFEIGGTKIKPSKIICLGRNYLDHIKETNAQVPTEPIFFIKTINTLITDNKPIIFPKICYESQKYKRVDHEVELAFIMFQTGKNIAARFAFDYIQGYSIFLDITARDMQTWDRNKKLPWYRSKNFDSFGPIGPKIIPCSEINDPHNLNIQLKVNGEIRQKSNTKHMLFRIPEMVEYISKFITLKRGDIIATGTPSGIGSIVPGDLIEASIDKIGKITHQIILEE